MFQFLSESSTLKSGDSKLSFLSLGKAKELPEERVNLRIDLLTEILEARLPERGYFKH